MVLNYIWVGFFVVAFVFALIQSLFFNDYAVFERIMNSSFDMAKFAVMDICLPLVGIMSLWLGFMNIGEKAGAIRFLSRIVGPFFSKLFPGVPKDHPVNGELLMNFSANMLGLDNAATPLGLKAMQSLQELNPHKESASNAQIMFLALNTSGLTIIPISIIAQRAILGAANPTDVFVPIIIATYVSTLTAILYVGFRQRLSLFNKTVVAWLGGISLLLAALVFWFTQMDKESMRTASSLLSNGTLLGIIILFMAGGLYKKINIWESFIDGAKNGFKTSVKIIPYLVGMLVGIGVLRASGALDFLTDGIAWLFNGLRINTDFVDALPTALMKPLSGSGARAMMIEAMKMEGADSFVGRLACVFQGSTDTTFYIIALYFGSVGIKRTRYAVSAGLIADLAGIIASILLAYLFFHR
ncbi:MAG: spore maturation protein [Bacteroidales bacterium]|jgi:spore maturation protein SpmA|nr:spore maturation protein [Bacteroidales bacterium]OQC03589.1 MAG: Spore maturation protein B [Bacteroidetes bacterium ADurb.Bin090]MBP8981563.1 spore maturation protein [Bacteroidales bacterium]NLV38102.1 spore maturation protein [Bacteroidales bacterium]HNZ80922.1 nucleoside recognition domain-containing protein [Bacteroidales bacterium]